MYNTGMKKKDLFKKRIFEIIQIGNTSDMPSRTFDIILVAAIILNILTLFLETFDSLSAWSDVFFVTESVTILFFCIEYALRIWTAEFLFPGRSRAEATWRFLISFDDPPVFLDVRFCGFPHAARRQDIPFVQGKHEL